MYIERGRERERERDAVKPEMFGNRLEFGFSGEVFAPSM